MAKQQARKQAQPAKDNGRPPHQPEAKDRQTVEVLAGFGIPALEIARVVGVSINTLKKHYATELENGAAKVEAKLVGNLLRLSNGTDGTALKATMFALQSRFGWSQYAARPTTPEEELGKKEAANVAAQTAHNGTGWATLVH